MVFAGIDRLNGDPDSSVSLLKCKYVQVWYEWD